MKIENVVEQAEDILFPHFKCDAWERALYYYLMHQSRFGDFERVIISLSQIAHSLQCSEWKARQVIRELHKKGCIELDQTRKGQSVKFFLPDEFEIDRDSREDDAKDVETIDFYRDRKYLRSIIERERFRCFYCLKQINEQTCDLDHVISLSNGGDNGYRNIVASCHSCNTRKQGDRPEHHIRNLFRKRLLSEDEVEERLDALQKLQRGEYIPII